MIFIAIILLVVLVLLVGGIHKRSYPDREWAKPQSVFEVPRMRTLLVLVGIFFVLVAGFAIYAELAYRMP